MSKKIILSIFIVFLALISGFIISNVSNGNIVLAEDKQTLLLPQTEREYFSFDDLQSSSFSWDNNYAVITNNVQDSSQNALWISLSESEFIKYDGLVVKNPHQVRYFTNNKLLVLDNDNLYTINLSNLSEKATQLFYQAEPISGRCFSVNDTYLATISGTTIIVYSHQGTSVTEKTSSLSVAKDLTPFCLDNNDKLYYIDADNTIMVRTLTSTSKVSIITLDQGTNVLSIIADENFLYYLTGENAVFQINLTTKERVKLTSNSEYDLGNIDNPTDITFKGNNLLVTDRNGIQEFAVISGSLSFTGYAIANGKTAYNRVGALACDIEQYGDRVAILDDYKLTIINTKDFNAYDKKSFINLFCGDAPSMFSLGNEQVLTQKNGVVTIKNYITDKTIFSQLIDGVKDTCYQSGIYYILTCDGINSNILLIDENGKLLDTLLYEQQLYNSICVDVLGNIKLYSDGKKYLSDLIASIYFINGSDFRLEGNTDYKEKEKDNIRSFSMSFDKKEVYFISDASGFIYQTVNVSNKAISAIETPDGFLIPKSSTNLSDLHIYTIKKDNANLYSISDGENGYLTFDGYAKKENAYCLLYQLDITLKDKMLILAGINGVILVNEVDTKQQAIQFSETPQTAYANTDVYMYYLPLITPNGEYRLQENESYIKIEKGSFISVQANSKVEFGGKDFYFASYIYSGITKSGYIPVAFTVEVLSKDHAFINFSNQTVSATTLYLEKGLTTKLADIGEGSTVRVFATENNISSVAVKIDGEWVTGYIYSSAIKDSPNVAIRNIFIILGVLACISLTTTYFLLRKKH